jgi:hypothetical protein
MRLGRLVIALALAGCGTILGASDDDPPVGPAPASADASTDGEDATTVSVVDDAATGTGDGAIDGTKDGGSDAPSNPNPCSGTAQCERFVFVTSITYRGDFVPANADTLCRDRAEASSVGTLHGRAWRAWITTSTENISKRFGVAGAMPYRRVDGTIVANNYADLTNGTLENAINVDENGNIVTTDLDVWTGTMTNGEYITTNCTDWGSTMGNGKVGQADLASNKWTDNKDIPCNDFARLYCFEY